MPRSAAYRIWCAGAATVIVVKMPDRKVVVGEVADLDFHRTRA